VATPTMTLVITTTTMVSGLITTTAVVPRVAKIYMKAVLGVVTISTNNSVRGVGYNDDGAQIGDDFYNYMRGFYNDFCQPFSRLLLR
jgi:hypothetical protein